MAPGQRRRSSPSPDPLPGTARRILEHARQAFNQRGVVAVGIREIARELGLSPGNVSYHFPTKEALVTALVREGHAANNALVSPPAPLRTFDDLDAAVRAIMHRDLENRWLLRDYVGLLVAMPAFRALHDEIHPVREARIDTLLARTVEAGLLERELVARRRSHLRQQIFNQVFFWLPAAMLAVPVRDPALLLDHHARATMGLFLAYCTGSRRRQLEALVDGASRPRTRR